MKKAFAQSALILLLLATGMAVASSGKTFLTPDEALRKLLDGNKRFMESHFTCGSRCDGASRKALADSQKPYAVILSCSDSRVPPEIIFDKGLGEIFVVRVAGNVPDPVVLGSIEYAAEHLGAPLIMVLGHERCGAVKATVEAKGQSTGSRNIDAVVRLVAPSVEAGAKHCKACQGNPACSENKAGELIECVVDANTRRVAAGLIQHSDILRHLAEEKRIRIVAAKYDLDEGSVTLLD